VTSLEQKIGEVRTRLKDVKKELEQGIEKQFDEFTKKSDDQRKEF
jgi:hypothetical protein